MFKYFITKLSQHFGLVWLVQNIVLALGIICVLSSVQATVVKKATIESLSKQSQLIVHAKVTEQWTPTKRGIQGQIYTYTRLAPIEFWYGKTSQPELILVQLGGSIGDLHLKVHGDAQLKVGDEVVLFLTKAKENVLPADFGEPKKSTATLPYQVVHLVSLAQGAFYVQHTQGRQDITLTQHLDDLVFYQPQAPQLQLALKPIDTHAIPVWTLTTLKSKVRSLFSPPSPLPHSSLNQGEK